MHDEDPVNERPKYHGETRGVRRVFVRSQTQHTPFPDETMDPTVKYWDVRMEKVGSIKIICKMNCR